MNLALNPKIANETTSDVNEYTTTPVSTFTLVNYSNESSNPNEEKKQQQQTRTENPYELGLFKKLNSSANLYERVNEPTSMCSIDQPVINLSISKTFQLNIPPEQQQTSPAPSPTTTVCEVRAEKMGGETQSTSFLINTVMVYVQAMLFIVLCVCLLMVKRSLDKHLADMKSLIKTRQNEMPARCLDRVRTTRESVSTEVESRKIDTSYVSGLTELDENSTQLQQGHHQPQLVSPMQKWRANLKTKQRTLLPTHLDIEK